MEMEAELTASFDTSAFPASEAYPADINGDGRMEILFLQGTGICQSDVFDGSDREISDPRLKRIFCITAVDLEGNVLWQYGTPFTETPKWPGHVVDQALCCVDLDGDGKMEIAALHRDRLVLLDGETGRLLKSVDLDADNYSVVVPFRWRGETRLLVKNTEREYQGYWYGDPACIFDAEFGLVAKIPRIVGSGHSPRAFDINGDGDEELLIGFEAYDGEGDRLWQLPDPTGKEYVPLLHHVDQLQVGPLGPGGEMCVVYAGSWDIKLATLDGRLLWQYELGHPQHVLVGDFRGAEKRAPLAFMNVQINGFWHTIGEHLLDSGARHGLELRPEEWSGNALIFADREGELVQIFYPEDYWPGTPGRTGGAHSGEGILILPQGCPDGSDAVIVRDWGWPRVVNLDGEQPFVFPYPKPSNPSVNADGYGMRVFDADADGRAEVLVHDRNTAWLFKPPFPEAGRPNTHAGLRPTTGQGWYGV